MSEPGEESPATFVKRFPFLDWMRGLAVVIMIQCHTFNSFVRLDLRDGGPYVYSQFVGGMAAPLFLFMAGMTTGFQMESLARREPSPLRRWLVSLKRAGYILGIAFLFRFTNYLGSLPGGSLQEITKVDILNCMAVGLALFAAAALFDSANRVRFALLTALAIAAATPPMAQLPWEGVPRLFREYLVPLSGRGQFAFFPCASYVGFGLAAGVLVKRAPEEGFERLMLWSGLGGLVLVYAAQYLSNLPFSLYSQTSFWTDNPALILIRVGVILAIMAGAYVWTAYCAGAGWSWMQCLGKNSLMVYWVHVMMVYGSLVKPIKRTMAIPAAAAATLLVTALMLALSAAWLRWKARRREVAKTAVAA
jgi:uncharacterized membrane protein